MVLRPWLISSPPWSIMRLKLSSWIALRSRYTRGHSCTSRAASTCGVPPVHEGFVRRWLDNHTVSGVILAALFPPSTIDSCPILQGVHQSALKAPEPRMFVVIEHAQQAQVVVVKGLGQGH